MKIKIVENEISLEELKELAQEFYGTMIKGAIDVENEILALGGEYHMDANNVLIEKGLKQPNIWGFNINFEKEGDDWIEYTSLINIRPAQGNRAMELADENLKKRIKEIINKKVKKL